MEGKEKNKNILIGVLVAIVLILAALCIYFVYIKNDSNNDVIYKDSNGKLLKIVESSNTDALNSFKNYLSKALSESAINQYINTEFELNKSRYIVLYDNEMFSAQIINEDDNYLAISGHNPFDYDGMCGMYNFLIDKKNNLILPYNTSGTFDFVKTSKGYYFKDIFCADDLVDIYTVSWKRIGVSGNDLIDQNGNIYIVDATHNDLLNENNEYKISEFDINGNKLSSSESFKEIFLYSSVIYNDNVYIIVKDKENSLFLYDYNNKEKYKLLDNVLNIKASDYFLKNNQWISIDNDILNINVPNYGKFVYNVASKQLVVKKEDGLVNNNQEQNNNENLVINNQIVGSYQNKDGKILRVVDKDSEEVKNDERYINYKYLMRRDALYYGFYDNELMEFLYADNDDENFLILGGDIINKRGCFNSNFLLNKKTNTIENYGMEIYGIIKTEKGYYFKTHGGCNMGYNTKLYTSKWQLLGIMVTDKGDVNSDIYAYKDGEVIKYDINGNVLSKLSITGDLEIGPGIAVGSNMYFLTSEGNVLYLNNYNKKTRVVVSNDVQAPFLDNKTKIKEENGIVIDYAGEVYKYDVKEDKIVK